MSDQAVLAGVAQASSPSALRTEAIGFPLGDASARIAALTQQVTRLQRTVVRQQEIISTLSASRGGDRGSDVSTASGAISGDGGAVSVEDVPSEYAVMAESPAAASEALLFASRSVARNRSISGVINTIMSRCRQLIGSDVVNFFILDHKTHELWSETSRGVDEIRFPITAGIAGYVARTGKVVNIDDAYTSPFFNPEFDRKTRFRTGSVLCLPVRDADGEILGVAQAINKHGARSFSQADIDLIHAFTAQVSVSIYNAIYIDKLNTLLTHQSTAPEREAADLAAILPDILTTAADVLEVPDIRVFLLERSLASGLDLESDAPPTDVPPSDAQRLVAPIPVPLALGSGSGSLPASHVAFPASHGLSGVALAERRTVCLAAVSHEPLYEPYLEGPPLASSFIATPLLDGQGRAVGVLTAANKFGARNFSSGDRMLVQYVANRIEGIVQHCRLLSQVVGSERLLRNIVHSLDQVLLILDDSGRLVLSNHRKQTAKLFPNTTMAALRSSHYSAWMDVDEMRAAVDAVLDSGVSQEAVDVDVRGAGTTIISFRASLLREADGAVRAKREITLNRYLSPAVASKVLADESATISPINTPSHAVRSRASMTQPEWATATVLFADIIGFSSMAESMDAPHVVALLNDYFPPMIDVVLERGGVLDKLIGDCVMATFGVPYPTPTDAVDAVDAALDMLDSIDAFNIRRCRDGLDSVQVGIGLHTGKVVAGNIGSLDRMDYTVVGDNVNLASRTEMLTRTYGVPLLVTEATLSAAGLPLETGGADDPSPSPDKLVRLVDRVRVKGKTTTVRVFQVARTKPSVRDMFAGYTSAYKAYQSREFDAAQQAFARLAEDHDDRPSAVMAARASHFAAALAAASEAGADPADAAAARSGALAAAGWNGGVWVMTSKF
ncbi:adenylate/guanylate cyclase with GAF and PAS/PAC sensor [Thecamonas trahens ATCC 50062]|uniref:Adenylate/guanylate cyclase with GAF and PAS/PAC sensor n=1 Tax=Thecamonas trahens ATCC 50062 TaxID=461836 RepID=A0A0L0DNV5_THETB|nr:adenylate/guanylate cyclase with GAF and PAS/PAC sensor [Thecamonas trahens ATCC 50062]KNC53078.1 adenylate/guanylate cyclase with GAF and PAS/PAC sensor [Thecamonas trahens ATCC 50062]|eukprot:XP_013754752.1 adenylate/guanylate cyclase with GAF and PAS/PAC sensor [Thecamonas trahens ATCC 50062]